MKQMKKLPLLLVPIITLLYGTTAHSQTELFTAISPPESDLSVCVDTGVIGDGFGFNDRCSCSIAPTTGFGRSLDINGDVLAIGSLESPQGCVASGTLAVFENINGEWQQTADLAPANNTAGDRFPFTVNIGSDMIVASSQSGRMGQPSGEPFGKITIFSPDQDGTWRETNQITHDFIFNDFSNAQYLANDDNTIVAFDRDVFGNSRLITYTRENNFEETTSFDVDSTFDVVPGLSNRNFQYAFDVSGDTLATVFFGDGIDPDFRILTIFQMIDNVWEPITEFEIPVRSQGGLNQSISVAGDTIIYSYGDNTVTNDFRESTLAYRRDGQGNWSQQGVDNTDIVAAATIDDNFGFSFFDASAEVELSPAESSFLYVRPNVLPSAFILGAGEFRSLGAIPRTSPTPLLLLFDFIDNQWSTTASLEFSSDLGISNEIGFSSAYDGDNILLGTLNDETVLLFNADLSTAATDDMVAATSVEMTPNTDNVISTGLPTCASSASDPDGDGFGFENDQSCLVDGSSASGGTSTGTTSGGFPTCASAATDPDGDGFGFENGQSCLVDGSNTSGGTSTGTTSGGFPICASAATDPDGDGFGFENGQSCLVDGSSTSGGTSTGTTSGGFPICASAATDPDGDGFGFENGQSCLVDGSSTSGGTSTGTTSGGFPTCASAATDPDGDGFGFENNQSCIFEASL